MNTDHSNLRDAVYPDGLSLEQRLEDNLHRMFRSWFPTVSKLITAVSSPADVHGANETYDRFQVMLRRIRSHPRYQPRESAKAPYGQFAHRAIIGETTSINQGVYLSAVAKEALVVDHTHGALDRAYNELIAWIRARGGRAITESRAIESAITVVDRFIRYSPDGYQKVIAREAIRPDAKTSLDLFIQEGSGEARHQVLLAAFLIERLQQQGILRGHLTIDPLSHDETGDDERLIYTTSTGSTFIFSPRAHAQLT